MLTASVKFVNAYPALQFQTPMRIMEVPGDPSTFFVAERGAAGVTGPAKVRRFPKTATAAADLKDVATITVNGTGEGGLLGLALHPDWQTNHTLFVSYTRDFNAATDPAPSAPAPTGPMTSIIAKLTSSDGGLTAAGLTEILRVGQPYTNHKGGDIAFGNDGYLYFGLGDGGSGNDPFGAGQNLKVPLGKILRIDVNQPPYGIPPTNPFANATDGTRKEIFAYGFRNPFRWNFDRVTGDLWVGDVGQNAWEEIDRVALGGNYGWKNCEGKHKLGSTTVLCDLPGAIDPIVEHGRSEAVTIIGGSVYRGKAIPELAGTYIYSDFGTGNVWGITYGTDGKPRANVLVTGFGQVTSFYVDSEGELYATRYGNSVWKLVSNGSPEPSTPFPAKLSETGCVNPQNPMEPSAGMIPYDLRSPLWSDGAEKTRFMSLPDGKQITVAPDGDFLFPQGTVLMKTFSVGGKRVETRLFMLHDDGEWGGYSYEWNDAQTEATLLPAGKTRDLGGGSSWTYPSRAQCMQCHTAAAGGSLGLEVGQLNRDFVYTSTNRVSNQLATLDHIGVFDKTIGDPSTLAKYPEPSGSDPVDARARSYLHANCAHCHRPQGGGGGTIDLRYATSFTGTQTCNQAPKEGPVGPADAKVLVPGDPAKSILSLRMHAVDAKRMPPLAVNVVDPLGTKVVDDWITSVKACP